MTTTIVSVNIYRSAGEWCYRADTADEFDHSDGIDVLDGASEAEATAKMAKEFPAATIKRVQDI